MGLLDTFLLKFSSNCLYSVKKIGKGAMEKVVVGRDTERSEAETGCLSACLCVGGAGGEGEWSNSTDKRAIKLT